MLGEACVGHRKARGGRRVLAVVCLACPSALLCRVQMGNYESLVNSCVACRSERTLIDSTRRDLLAA